MVMSLSLELKQAVCASPCVGTMGQGCCVFHFAFVPRNQVGGICWYCIYGVSLEFALETLRQVYAGKDFRYRKLDLFSYRIYSTEHPGYDMYLF